MKKTKTAVKATKRKNVPAKKAKQSRSKRASVQVAKKPKRSPKSSNIPTQNVHSRKELLDFIDSFDFQTGDVNATMSDGATMLHVSVAGWHIAHWFVDAAKFLISRGADVNARDKSGHTPLRFAIVANNIEAVKFFISNPLQSHRKMEVNIRRGHSDVTRT